MAIIVDSYSESNVDDYQQIATNIISAAGQSFRPNTTVSAYSAKFYLKKVGSPTGNAFAKIYALTGTPGTNSSPTGSALATSDALNVATLSTSPALIELLFTGANQIVLNSSTDYFVIFECVNTNSSNYVHLGGDFTSPGDSGANWAYFILGSWMGENTGDIAFYVYGNTLTFTKTHTTSASLRVPGTKIHTTDSLLRKVNTKTHTTNSSLAIERTRGFQTDALLKKRFTRTFTTDALLRKQLTTTHTTDTILRRRVVSAKPFVFIDPRQDSPIGFK